MARAVADFKSGRIDTLSIEQELVLKQIWANLLTFWGYDIKYPTKHVNPAHHTLHTINPRASVNSNFAVNKDKTKEVKRRNSINRLTRKASIVSKASVAPSVSHSIAASTVSLPASLVSGFDMMANYSFYTGEDVKSIHTINKSRSFHSGYVPSTPNGNTWGHDLERIDSVETFVTAETTIDYIPVAAESLARSISPEPRLLPVNSPARTTTTMDSELSRSTKATTPIPGLVKNVAKNRGKVHPALAHLDPETIENNFWKMLRTDSPDNLLLRFVRARKFDVSKALEMVSKSLEWRLKECEVEKVVAEGDYVPYFKNEKGLMLNYTLGKSYIRGYDKAGRPIVIVRPKLHHAKDQNMDEMRRFALMVIENSRLFLVEPTDACSVIFDLSDFSLSNMDWAPVNFLLTCFEAHYPESLGVLLIHKAPWVFSGIWNIIKKLLDPVVASKINFTKNIKDLSKFIDVEQLPAYMGGKDSFAYKYIPPTEEDGIKPADDIKEELTSERESLVMQFIDSTKKWVEASTPEEDALYFKERRLIGKRLSNNFVDLDPYTRNRTYYDRTGALKLEKISLD